MTDISRRIIKQFPIVRVDFYELEIRIYVGILTFYPDGGLTLYSSKYWDYKLGEMLILPQNSDESPR